MTEVKLLKVLVLIEQVLQNSKLLVIWQLFVNHLVFFR